MADNEVIWATSTTGEDFQCVHVDAWRAAQTRVAELEAALKRTLIVVGIKAWLQLRAPVVIKQSLTPEMVEQIADEIMSELKAGD
jgi:hypothetical protein